MHYTEIFPALAQALQSDPALAPDRVRKITDRLFGVCAESPAALKRLIELKPVMPKTASWYFGLLEHVLPGWPSDTMEREFLDWLERRTSEKAIHQLIEFRRVCVRQPQRELLLSPSQQRAWEYLHRCADIFFDGAWHQHRIVPNFNLLIAAPSGAGKSFLVTAFAETRALPLMRLAYGQWIPAGARKQPDTVAQLRDFLLRHDRCCLYLDEIDKAGTGESLSEWGAGVAGEIYATLDRTIFDSRGSEPESSRQILCSRLRRSTFIVVTGTWQTVFRHAGRTAGFGGAKEFDPASAIAEAHKIPEELPRRVGSRPLLLEPPSAADLRSLCRKEGLAVAARQAGVKLDYAAAVESGEAMRWLGDVRLQVEMRRHAKTQRDWRPPAPIAYLEVTQNMEVNRE